MTQRNDLQALISSYKNDISAIEAHRESVKEQLSRNLPHQTARHLEELYVTLTGELLDLRHTADTLIKQAAPKPPSPSLLTRERTDR